MSRTVSLWPDHLALAERLVADGRFESVDEVVTHAFALLEDAEAARAARLARLRAHLDEGLADLEAGRAEPAADVFLRLRAKIAEKRSARDAAE